MISSLSPSAVTAGGTAFTLTVNGSGFAGLSTVQWNGSTGFDHLCQRSSTDRCDTGQSDRIRRQCEHYRQHHRRGDIECRDFHDQSVVACDHGVGHHHDLGWKWNQRVLRRLWAGFRGCSERESRMWPVDGSGNVFIAEEDSGRIRKISPSGIITTVVGGNSAPCSGEPAPVGFVSLAQGLALDAAGNLFISDAGDYRVVKLGTDGTFSVIAGNGSYGFSGDGGPAKSAAVACPVGIAVDAFRAMYFSPMPVTIASERYHRTASLQRLPGTEVPASPAMVASAGPRRL